MSVMPNLTSAAINDPDTYIATLREALMSLKAGSAHVRTLFAGEYLNFRSEDVSELRAWIIRLQSLSSKGQLAAPRSTIDDPMPWARPR
jgi:hypothetical protein